MTSRRLPATSRVRHSLPALLAVFILTAALLGGLAWFHARTNVPYLQFTRDTAALRACPWYTGILSQLGVMAWTAGAAAALTGAGTLRKKPEMRPWSRYLLIGGVFSAWLALDDALMLHEVVIPRHIGLDERLVYATYIAAALAFFGANRREVLAGEWPLLAVALALLAVPAALDMLGLTADVPELLMAGSKLAGIFSWAAYWGLTAIDVGALPPSQADAGT